MMVARQSVSVIGASALVLGVLIALQVYLGQWQVPEKKWNISCTSPTRNTYS